ncbi:MAG: NADH-quinone oxidoreductase subunit M [Cyclobacteriaceae bacterium]
MSDHLLSLIVFIPLVGSLLLFFLKDDQHELIKRTTLIVSLLQFIATCWMGMKYDYSFVGESMMASFQMVEKSTWFSFDLGKVGQFVIEYHLGVDGFSFPMVMLSSLILLIGVVSSWSITQQVKGYFVLYLLLSTSIYGCFLALDFFLFYLFFELMLLPMFFLIGIWGGPKRSYASIKFFIYTLVGSLLILIVMIGLYLSVLDPSMEDVHTFNLLYMMDGSNYDADSLLAPGSSKMLWGQSIRLIAFLALVIGFAIKLPAVPFHTWLPDAHVEAPTSISVILASLLLKVGGYGILRIAYSIFPEGAIHYANWIAGFGVLSIIYGGLNSLAQRDLKRLIAYSSVSHMGFVMVGLAALTAEGVSGMMFQMVSHGLISAALFLVVGVIYDRTHDREIENYSGLATRLPRYTFVVVIVFFASLGLPGLSGFVGELLVLMGAFGSVSQNGLLDSWIGFVSVLGIVISAIYYLWVLQRMFFGSFWVRHEEWLPQIKDLSRREWIMFIPLLLLIVLLGVYPRVLLDPMNGAVIQFVDHVTTVGNLILNK